MYTVLFGTMAAIYCVLGLVDNKPNPTRVILTSVFVGCFIVTSMEIGSDLDLAVRLLRPKVN